MKVLIVTTFYPPDTAVAAVRPYMFAKYLTKLGHEVTVLRSGEIEHGFSSFYKNDPSVRVISFLGDESPAERYERGENIEELSSGGRFRFIPVAFRSLLLKIYFLLFGTPSFSKTMSTTQSRVQMQKNALDRLSAEHFDVVFATYGLTENIFAGQYAAQLFDCPLIQDFRDTLANREFQNRRQYAVMKKIQDDAVKCADICTAVSEGVLREVCSGEYQSRGRVLYNGFEYAPDADFAITSEKDVLSFCYTGQVYAGKRDFSPLLMALRKLADENKISLDKVRIHYAGRDFEYLYQKAQKYGVANVVIDHGHMQREDVLALQKRSDLFVVLSWNTKKSQGVLTGKFYEGIRAHKPILAIVAGEVPNSELNLIEQTYHYGFCYETSRKKEQFSRLCDYIEKAYQDKMASGAVEYAPNAALAEDFRYDILSKRLEEICHRLIREK